MFLEQFFLLIVVLILGFAFLGFISFLRMVFGDQSTEQDRKIDDALATCRTLDRLVKTGALSWSEYRRARSALIEAYPLALLPPLLKQPAEASDAVLGTPPVDTAGAEALTAVPPVPPVRSVLAASRAVVGPPKVHPLDLPPEPDLPYAELGLDTRASLRRSWSDMTAAFMQEKNIRWGELASGILIVGSALGLVISLREELRETIPYFPALLFMLITAAIHAAGVYTLRRWRLRNTSRGILIIALLLIPLNILAACVLSGDEEGRRPVSDPVYWLAIVVGLAAFSTMACVSSRCLLRRRHVPLSGAVMIGAVAMLIVNRVAQLHAGSAWTAMLGIMPLLGFVSGTLGAVPAITRRTHWSERVTQRLWLCSGVAGFALIVALGLLLFRSTNYVRALVSLAPVITTVGLLLVAMGLSVLRSRSSAVADRQRVAASAISIGGALLIVLSVLLARLNPTVLAATTCWAGIASWLLARKLSFPPLFGASGGLLAVALVAGLHLASGRFVLDAVATANEWLPALISAMTGQCLFVWGAVICLLSRPAAGTVGREGADRAAVEAWHWWTGIAVGTLGAVVAVLASFWHANVPLEVHTATVILGLVCLAVIGTAVRARDDRWAHAAAVGTLAFLSHALYWNEFIANGLRHRLGNAEALWTLIAIGTGSVLAVAAAVRQRVSARSRSEAASLSADRSLQVLSGWGMLASAVGMICASQQLLTANGVATFLATCGFANIALTARTIPSVGTSAALSLAGMAAVSTAVAEVSVVRGWSTSLLSLRQAFLQVSALATVTAVWQLAAELLRRRGWVDWATQDQSRAVRAVVRLLSVALTIPVIVASVAQVMNEAVLVPPAIPFMGGLMSEVGWAALAWGSVMAALLVSLVIQPQAVEIKLVVSLGLIGWMLPAFWFEPARAVGSALRWLLAAGAALTGLILGSRSSWLGTWRRLRSKFDLTRTEPLPISLAQDLVNLSLVISVAAVLSITTLTVARVMLHGATSLGGPLWPSYFATLRKDVSFGGPIAILVTVFLGYAITEGRVRLAVAGSLVYQYFVLLAVVLLFLSPHPKLASEWFLHILQAVSLGMSSYGLGWYSCRRRIRSVIENETPFGTQLDIHVLINTGLVLSLAVLIAQHFFFHPFKSAGWINEAGGWLGAAALGAALGVAELVWGRRFAGSRIAWLAGAGFVATAFVASVVDRHGGVNSVWPLRVLAMGLTGVVWGDLLLVMVRSGWASDNRKRVTQHRWSMLPLFLVGVAAQLFVERGLALDNSFRVGYLTLTMSLNTAIVVYALRYGSRIAPWIAGGLAVANSRHWLSVNPWASWQPEDEDHLWLAALSLVALVCKAFYVAVRAAGRLRPDRRFLSFSNAVTVVGVLWLLLLGAGEHLAGDRILAGSAAHLVIALVCLLVLCDAWSDLAIGRVRLPFLLSLALMLILGQRIASDRVAWEGRFSLELSLVGVSWGYLYSRRTVWAEQLHRYGVARRSFSESIWRSRLPGSLHVTGLVLVSWTAGVLLISEPRSARYMAAISPMILAFSYLLVTRVNESRGLRIVTISVTTIGAVCLSWADAAPDALRFDQFQLPLRTTLALSTLLFAFSWWLPFRLRPESVWIDEVRRATAALSVCAVGTLVWLVGVEMAHFRPQVGCGVPFLAALAILFVGAGMISGLIAMAVLPQHDPLALSTRGRTAYVYAAQVLSVLLGLHLYLAKPQWFQLGVLQYWPYLSMLLAFGGVGMSQLLQRRKLQVLAQPLFHSAVLLPFLTAVGYFAVDSQTEGPVVMLSAGVLFLLICVVQQSFWSGVVAASFANLALWMFYDRVPSLAFLAHPQLWLIPPAVSVLIAGQVQRANLRPSQLAAVRYLSAAVIYLSSTSEILITGLGQGLLPPVVLSLMSVAGIFAGMVFQVRAFLFLGATFLFLSVVTMVAHAQQRLHHVWPWWAFGLLLGAAILFVFGLFESKRNQLRSIALRLRQWDY